MTSTTQQVYFSTLEKRRISLFIRRDDLLHPVISGNKYRKLKYNLQEAARQGEDTLLTFGGAYSNHLAATAWAGREGGFKTIGIVRGEEFSVKATFNPTLTKAQEQGMHLKFVTREAYREKETNAYLAVLRAEFGPFYHLPEGGTNALAVKGCEEILSAADAHFDFICCAVGTGGTLAGLINASTEGQQVLGFPALKGTYLQKDICSFVRKRNWRLINDYHFGGYAKINEPLVAFINNFRDTTGIPLDPVYTGKLLYGLTDMIGRGVFAPGTRILAIHSGGLQGIAGMNQVLERKKLPLICV